MAVTVSSLTVTPTWSSKRLTIDGTASVRESVALRIVGCGVDTSVVFKLSSENGRVDYAKFPNATTDAWVVDGDDLAGTLNLNTELLVAAFAPLCPEDRMDLVCTVASKANSNLYAIGHKQIGNWMEDTDDPVAYATPLADAIAALDAQFDTHTHNGTDAPKVSHFDLTNKGSNTHEQIDTALSGIAASLVTHASGIATNASNIAANAQAIEALDGAVLKIADFSEVEALPTGSTTMKALREKINEILALLKGQS